MIGSKTRVFFPDSQYGIPDSEITIAEKLKENGYKNAIIGKWHLGHKKEYLPLQHGFDYYFGIPYSNDMDQLMELPAVLDQDIGNNTKKRDRIHQIIMFL